LEGVGQAVEGDDGRMVQSLDCSLCVILDSKHIGGRDIGELTRGLCVNGASMIQYRAKGEGDSYHWRFLPPVIASARQCQVPVIINDDLDLAILYGADGVHLGQRDMPVAEARKRGGGIIVGATVHDVEEAGKAIKDGADYISLGSIYKTSTKEDIHLVGLDVLASVCRYSTIPTIAIGGIDGGRIDEVLGRGADGIAVVSAVLDGPDPAQAVRRLRGMIDGYRCSPPRISTPIDGG